MVRIHVMLVRESHELRSIEREKYTPKKRKRRKKVTGKIKRSATKRSTALAMEYIVSFHATDKGCACYPSADSFALSK